MAVMTLFIGYVDYKEHLPKRTRKISQLCEIAQDSLVPILLIFTKLNSTFLNRIK